MQKHILITSIFTAAALFTVAGCSSNQAVKTTDGKTIGLSAPTGQKYSIAAIEIVGTPALDALTALPWTI